MSDHDTPRPVVYGNARFVARAGTGDELQRRLLAVLASARQEPGNRSVEMYRSIDQPSIFYVHSAWADDQALGAHFAQPYVREFLDSGAELQAEPNTVGFGPMISEPETAAGPGPDRRDRLYGIARFVAKAGSEHELEQTLLGLITPTRAETGNLGYDLFRSKDNPALFYLHESWRDQAAVQTHAAQPHAREARATLEKLSAEPFAVGFGTLVRADGGTSATEEQR